MPAVKANAYGHGAIAISKQLNANGIKTFCVATVSEGVELRKNRIKGEILVLGYTHPQNFPSLLKYRLTQTVVDYPYAVALNSYGKKVNVHIEVDTGMRRSGERCDNIDEILDMFTFKNLAIKGIYTHLCVSDGNGRKEKAFTQMQINNFKHVLNSIEERGFDLPKIHISSSYGIYNYPDLAYDYVRVGIALYGMLSEFYDTIQYKTELQPVLSIKARVGTVKTLYAEEAAGYGITFTASNDMKIAVITIGYADGFPRTLSNGNGHVLLNGRKAPVIGRVCMDQMVVDVTDIPDVRQGDMAIIIGKSGENEITACEMAKQTNSIANDILSRLGQRLHHHPC
jgi:serine/alanine racemase